MPLFNAFGSYRLVKQEKKPQEKDIIKYAEDFLSLEFPPTKFVRVNEDNFKKYVDKHYNGIENLQDTQKNNISYLIQANTILFELNILQNNNSLSDNHCDNGIISSLCVLISIRKNIIKGELTEIFKLPEQKNQ